MNLKNEKITSSTHPLLVQMIHAYQPSVIPTREELVELNYEPYQLDGHVNIRDLCKDIGVNYDEAIDDRRPHSGEDCLNPFDNVSVS